MVRTESYLSMILIVVAVVSVVVGAIFIYQGMEKESWMKEAMRLEKVTLGLSEEMVQAGELVDSAEEAQIAGDTIREHRRGIASTYDELLGGGRYDPANPAHLSYAQALNMENYLYLGVLGFGVTTMLIGIGVFMILTGLGFGVTGIILIRIVKTMP